MRGVLSCIRRIDEPGGIFSNIASASSSSRTYIVVCSTTLFLKNLLKTKLAWLLVSSMDRDPYVGQTTRCVLPLFVLPEVHISLGESNHNEAPRVPGGAQNCHNSFGISPSVRCILMLWKRRYISLSADRYRRSGAHSDSSNVNRVWLNS